MSNISAWSTSAASNNAASPDGFPEAMLPSGVNDSAREVMAAVRKWYVDAEWINHGYVWVRQSNNSFLVSITATDVFTAGRRLRMLDATTIYGDVIASSMSGANTLVTVSSSNLSSSLSSGSVAIIDPANSSVPHMNALAITASVTASDYIEIWQSGTGLRRRALRNNIAPTILTLGTATGAAGTAVDFTGIPAGVKHIIITLDQVSTNGTSNLLVQIGDAGGIENASYNSTVADLASGSVAFGTTAAGFAVTVALAATDSVCGTITLSLNNSGTFTWTMSGSLMRSTTIMSVSSGSKALSAELDRVRITTAGGANTFDGGGINIQYE